MNIGVFGGTFDPPHTGHLIVAQDAALALSLDGVLFVPAAHPPHKKLEGITEPSLRARMVELAIAGNERFRLSTIELGRDGPSYTVDTLRALAAAEPDVRWTLLLGADQYADFETWRDPAGIRALARIAVLTRAGVHDEAGEGRSLPGLRTLANGDVLVDVARIDISATAIRRRIRAGMSIRYLVPAAVEALIFEQRLYTRNGAVTTGYRPESTD